MELWLTRNRAHSIVKDAGTGRVLSESTFTPTEHRIYDAEARRVTVYKYDRPSKGMPFNAATFEAAVQKAYLEQGITKVVGETVVDGRRALITESVKGKWRSDAPENVTTAVVDAETFRLYTRSTVASDGSFSQVADHEVVEVLPASGATARMAMTKRPGVKVRALQRKRRG